MIDILKKNKLVLYSCVLVLSSLFHFKAFSKNDTLIVITTSQGVIKLKLYEDTPKHRHNFIKLVKSGFYDSLLFHRIIAGFMIQGGDPDSKKADLSVSLGNGDNGYTIPSEILPIHFHKKGALAAARQSDDTNPEKESSGCQFYIVQGKKYSELDLVTVESRMVNQLKQNLMWKYLAKPENKELRERYVTHQQNRSNDSLVAISKLIQPFIESELKNQKQHKFNNDEKLIYAKQGGSPHLDGNYTVFGEVIQGLDVIDKLAEVEVLGNNRPKNDIRMKVTLEIVNN